MNKEIENKVILGLDKLTQWAESTENIISEQAPLVAREIMAYSLWTHSMQAVLFAVISIVAAIVLYKFWSKCQTLGCSAPEPYIMAQLVSGVVILFSVPLCICQIDFVVQIVVAPRMFMLEYIGHLVG